MRSWEEEYLRLCLSAYPCIAGEEYLRRDREKAVAEAKQVFSVCLGPLSAERQPFQRTFEA